MRHAVGILILGYALVPLLLAADAVPPREVAQGKAVSADAKSDTKPEAPATGGVDGKAGTKAKAKASPGITPEREAATQTFVEQHHPELAVLLVHLKENNKKEYDKAVRDLFRASERLSRIHETDIDRYDLELKLWQTQSHIDLIAARHKMAPTPELKAQLKAALVERQGLRKALVEFERDRTTEKLAKLDQQLKTFETSSDKAIDDQLQSLLGTSEKTDKPASKGTKSK